MANRRKKQPVIGVTGPGKRGRANWWFFKILVKLLGGRPLLIIPGQEPDIKELNGLILSGGADINPERYGREKESLPYKQQKRRWTPLKLLFYPFVQLYKEAFAIGSCEVNDQRDAMEFALFQAAREQQIPMMGICRGMQLMNVALSGSLYHDLKSLTQAVKHKQSLWPSKKITIEPGSLIAKLLGATSCTINSLHNQGVDKLGEGLMITARDEDGFVQALEFKDHPCCFGVQWHPEYMPFNPRQRYLLRQFIAFAK
jgi:putative glutamine amidotransferase